VLIRILGAHLMPYRRKLSVLLALQLIQITAMLLLPTLNADIVDNGLVPGDTNYILRVGALMLGVAVVQLISNIGAVRASTHIAIGVGRDIRQAIFRRVQDFSVLEVGKFGTASLTTRTLNDVQQIQTLALEGLTAVLVAPITCVVSVVLALQQGRTLTLVLLLLVPVTVGVSAGIILGLVPLYVRIQATTDRLNRVLHEQITGVRVVRAFVRDTHERTRFGRVNAELFRLGMRAGRLGAVMFPAIILIGNVFTVAVVWVGGHLIDAGQIEIGALSGFLGYLGLIITSVVIAVHTLLELPRARVSAHRIQEVLRTEPTMRPAAAHCGTAVAGSNCEGSSFATPAPNPPACRTSTCRLATVNGSASSATRAAARPPC